MQRKLICNDSKFYAVFKNQDKEEKYPANHMSDGVMSVLYLAAQVLCVPNDKILIIDEPEIHMHSSIMNKMWIELEKMRPDCLFIYITHNMEFAALHSTSDKIWVKNYDGTNWNFEKIEDDSLPEELLLKLLGARKNVIFTEGEKGSFDAKIITALYPNYYVVPSGSCEQVISRTKAFNNCKMLHDYSVFGIIDRDFRSEKELEAYRKDKIYPLEVAEIENLFLVEELIRFIASRIGANKDDVFKKISEFVIETKFKNMLKNQKRLAFVAEVKHELNICDVNDKKCFDDLNYAKQKINDIDLNKIKDEVDKKFDDVINLGHKEVLKVFNEKGVAKNIGGFLGFNNDKYLETVINLLNGNKSEEIKKAIKPYLPVKIV